jgi:hypothetical protein
VKRNIGKVDEMNKDIRSMAGDLKDFDRRLVRIETIVEFAGKSAVNKNIKSLDSETD